MDANILKYNMCLRILINIYATFEAQLMTKLSNTEAELKKALLIKKRVVDGFYLLDVLQGSGYVSA